MGAPLEREEAMSDTVQDQPAAVEPEDGLDPRDADAAAGDGEGDGEGEGGKDEEEDED
jgi:hypothetical protein